MMQRRYTEKQVDDWLEGLLRNYQQQAEILARSISVGETARAGRWYLLPRLQNTISSIGIIRREWSEYNRMLNADASRDIRRD